MNNILAIMVPVLSIFGIVLYKQSTVDVPTQEQVPQIQNGGERGFGSMILDILAHNTNATAQVQTPQQIIAPVVETVISDVKQFTEQAQQPVQPQAGGKHHHDSDTDDSESLLFLDSEDEYEF